MKWTVKFHEEFDPEFEALHELVQDELFSHAKLLEKFGPQLGRPTVDTLEASKFSNMKELRFRVAKEVWRVAFAFDPKRQAILLIAGNKGGKNQTRFYKELIRKADERFSDYLEKLRGK